MEKEEIEHYYDEITLFHTFLQFKDFNFSVFDIEVNMISPLGTHEDCWTYTLTKQADKPLHLSLATNGQFDDSASNQDLVRYIKDCAKTDTSIIVNVWDSLFDFTCSKSLYTILDYIHTQNHNTTFNYDVKIEVANKNDFEKVKSIFLANKKCPSKLKKVMKDLSAADLETKDIFYRFGVDQRLYVSNYDCFTLSFSEQFNRCN